MADTQQQKIDKAEKLRQQIRDEQIKRQQATTQAEATVVDTRLDDEIARLQAELAGEKEVTKAQLGATKLAGKSTGEDTVTPAVRSAEGTKSLAEAVAEGTNQQKGN